LKTETVSENAKKVSRHELIELLNQDLAREYQAIIGYVVYSQVLKGAEFMNIASELEKHAAQELSHALIIAKQIDYLGGMPAVEPKAVRTSGKAIEMLQFDVENETETIRNYRERVRQCEELAEYALGEQIREIFDRRTRPPNRSGDGSGQERAGSAHRTKGMIGNSYPAQGLK
jgi:bacterioferritin